VKAGSMALAGYYKMFCDNYNNKNWVMLTAGEDIPAGTEIRLVDVMGGGNGSGNGAIKVTYKDICEYGNDGTGFQCTAMDPTGANAGTTITVELRLYANESDPTDSSYNGGTETGEYYVIDTTTYTFPNAEVKDQAGLEAALASGANGIDVAAGTYTFPASKLDKDTTLYCEEGTVFEGTSSLNVNGATVVGATFKNDGSAVKGNTNGTFVDCVFEGSEALRWCYSAAGTTTVFENCVIKTDFRGFHYDNLEGEVIFRNCEINGFNAYGGEGTVTFEDCTFGCDESSYNGLNIYANTNLINCKFVFTSGKTNFIDMEGTDKTLTITNCTATLDGAAANVADFVGGSKLADNTVIYN